jgi:hypothetical protein
VSGASTTKSPCPNCAHPVPPPCPRRNPHSARQGQFDPCSPCPSRGTVYRQSGGQVRKAQVRLPRRRPRTQRYWASAPGPTISLPSFGPCIGVGNVSLPTWEAAIRSSSMATAGNRSMPGKWPDSNCLGQVWNQAHMRAGEDSGLHRPLFASRGHGFFRACHLSDWHRQSLQRRHQPSLVALF